MFHEVGARGYPLELFEQQLRYLTRHFTISPLPEALDRLRSGRIAGDELVLTFDDGLETHATRVYPVLERLRLPASFFVCPGLIEGRKGIWTLETRALLSDLPPDTFVAWARKTGSRPDVDHIVEWMKSLPISRRREVETSLRKFVGLEEGEDHTPPARRRLMSWEQLRRLDPDLVTIGSHSLTHPTLPLLEPSELERELRGSQELLERRLGRPARVFCYPDGAHDARIVEVTRRYYDAALTTLEGFARPGHDFHTLPRIPVAQSLPLLAWRLHRPTA